MKILFFYTTFLTLLFCGLAGNAKADPCSLEVQGTMSDENGNPLTAAKVVVTQVAYPSGTISTAVGYVAVNGDYYVSMGGCGTYTIMARFDSATPYSGVWQGSTSATGTFYDTGPIEDYLDSEFPTATIEQHWRFDARNCSINISGSLAELVNGNVDIDNTDGALAMKEAVFDVDGNMVADHIQIPINSSSGSFSIVDSAGYCGKVRLRPYRAISGAGYWYQSVPVYYSTPVSASNEVFLWVRQ